LKLSDVGPAAPFVRVDGTDRKVGIFIAVPHNSTQVVTDFERRDGCALRIDNLCRPLRVDCPWKFIRFIRVYC